MTLQEAILARHSVRQYEDHPLSAEAAALLRAEVERCNDESGLHIQLLTDEPKAFSGAMAHYGKFSGVRSYLALVGPKSDALDELCGYYGERLVLFAQTIGLNTCWVALTFSKGAAKKHIAIAPGEKLVIVIALGYGETQGAPRRSKSAAELSAGADGAPDWFRAGLEAARLAPTAINQQKFRLTLLPDGKVRAESLGGPYAKVDLGIVKYHFELGAGKDGSVWA